MKKELRLLVRNNLNAYKSGKQSLHETILLINAAYEEYA